MRKLIVGISIFLALLSAPWARAEGYEPFRDDHLKHTAVSLVGMAVGTYILERAGVERPLSQIVAGTTMMMVGIGKEIGDPEFSADDILADQIGIALGLGVTFAF